MPQPHSVCIPLFSSFLLLLFFPAVYGQINSKLQQTSLEVEKGERWQKTEEQNWCVWSNYGSGLDQTDARLSQNPAVLHSFFNLDNPVKTCLNFIWGNSLCMFPGLQTKGIDMTVEIKKTCVNKSTVLHSRETLRLSCCLPVGFTFLGSLSLRNVFAFWDQEERNKG